MHLPYLASYSLPIEHHETAWAGGPVGCFMATRGILEWNPLKQWQGSVHKESRCLGLGFPSFLLNRKNEENDG